MRLKASESLPPVNLGLLHLLIQKIMSVDSLFYYRDPRFLRRSEPRSERLNFTGGGPEQGGAANIRLGHDCARPRPGHAIPRERRGKSCQ